MRPVAHGGYGLDAQWLDDVHHAVRVAVTGERDGYYVDYAGLPDLARAARDRYVLADRYSRYRGHTVGRPAPDVDHHRFVVCTQNHDQVGNRMLGERLDALVDPARARFAAATILLLPFTPMLFMGEEHAEPAPFRYFVSHTEPDLVTAVREGRRREFAAFAWQGEAPDPQAVETFEVSRVDWSLRGQGEHARRVAMYTELLRLRREVDAIAGPGAGEPEVTVVDDELVWMRRRAAGSEAVTVLHAGDGTRTVRLPVAGRWRVAFDSRDPRWTGEDHPLGDPPAPPRPDPDGGTTIDLPPWTATLVVPHPEDPR